MNVDIEKKLKELPTKSGVYIMLGEGGVVIYVGKAKNLKNRVSSYFNKTSKTAKVSKMVENIKWFEYIITPTELDAFTLENNLIKKHQPFYNILLKDSKTFPYIKVNLKEQYPRFITTRKVLNDGFKYFGPFLAGVSANFIVDFLNKHFKLRNCKNNLKKPLARECLNYQLGLCLAPCTKKVSMAEYHKQVNAAVEFLKGDDKQVLQQLEEKMKTLAQKEMFEEAIKVRQTYNMVKKLSASSIANLPKKVDKDAICYQTNQLTSAVAVVTVRGGRILGVRSFTIPDPNIQPAEILENFIISYYQNAVIPKEIILNAQIQNSQTICQYFNKNINFITNPKGVNLKLLKMAEENAIEHIEKNISKDRQKYDNTIGALKVLQEKLKLKHFPRRMECYDISNISGTNKVSSMVVFINGEPRKSEYRKFKIKTVAGIDDFASLRETMVRRLTRLKNQDGNSFKEKPDLLIIDGGKGQLSSCVKILEEFNFPDIEMVSLAKRIEEVFVPHVSQSIILDHSTAPLKLLQRIRDEAHRFAITFHRQLRGKAMTKSELDGIDGVGVKKKQALLLSFENIEQIKNASIDQLASVKGIDLKLAHKIYNTFHKEN